MGDTVRILNGNVIEYRNDLNFPSPHSIGLSFAATYNSQSEILGSLGYGWNHTYSVTLNPEVAINGINYLKIADATGRAAYFKEITPEIYTGAFNEKSTVKVEDGYFVWYRLNDLRYAFTDAGKLTWIDDEKGNRLA